MRLVGRVVGVIDVIKNIVSYAIGFEEITPRTIVVCRKIKNKRYIRFEIGYAIRFVRWC